MRKGTMLVGYARGSKADDQNTAAQVKAMHQADASESFEEKASGGRWDRPRRSAARRLDDPLN
jgi:resolvase-like protein